MMKNFLDISDITKTQFLEIVYLAKELKLHPVKYQHPLRRLGMIFQKPSTRTRISFEIAIQNLGGNAIVLNQNDIHLGKNESIKDTTKVLSEMLDCIMIRCFNHQDLLNMANYASIPVVNGLTDYSHPCQILAAALTFVEHVPCDIEKLHLAWVGDCNNVLKSYVDMARLFEGITLKIVSPYKVDYNLPENVQYTTLENLNGVDVLITDTWISMGDKKEVEQKLADLKPFQVNERIIKLCNNNVVKFSHCLPAHRGHEVTNEVIDSNYSLVYQEAQNRIWVQQAVLHLLLSNKYK